MLATNDTDKKRFQYADVPHDATEIQRLSDPRTQDGHSVQEAIEQQDAQLLGTVNEELAKTKTELFRWENIAIPWCYLTVGLCQGRALKKK